MKLYNYYRSSASYRVRIALELKGLRYNYIAANLAQVEQHGGVLQYLQGPLALQADAKTALMCRCTTCPTPWPRMTHANNWRHFSAPHRRTARRPAVASVSPFNPTQYTVNPLNSVI